MSSRFHALQSDLGSSEGGLSEEEVLLAPQRSVRLAPAAWRTPTRAPVRRSWAAPAAVGMVGAAGSILVGAAGALAVAAGLTGAWLLLA